MRAQRLEIMMRVLKVVAAALSLLAVNAIMHAALASPSLEQCLEQTDQSLVGEILKETFRPSPLARYDNILADARGVAWRPRQPRRGLGVARYAVAFNGTQNCWIGGRIVGTGESTRTAPSAIAVGTGYRTSDTMLHLLDVEKTLNGLWIGADASDLNVENFLFSEIKGTCIIAEHDRDLIVDGVFLHKCARVVQLESQYPNSTFTIRNSIIRINNDRNVRTGGRLFSRRSLESKAQIYFENNIVATAAKLDERSLSILDANCSNNVLIWVGQGEYPGVLPDCFTVVNGKKAWREARAAWMEQHERQLAELGERLDPGGSVCSLPELPASPLPHKTVGSGTPASCTEGALRSALSGGGTVSFSCGSSPVTIAIGSELVISNPTALDGGGTVTLDGGDRTRIIRNNSQLTLKRITLRRGRKDVVWSGSPDGGAAVKTSYGKRLYVVDSTFVDNRSAQGFGGAIFQSGAGALTVVRSRFVNNVGGGGGAIYNLLAGLHVVDSAFVGNQSSKGRHGGGGIMTDGASADSGNGGSGGEILICGSSFDGNQALATGGGAYLYAYPRDSVSVTHSTFTANSVLPNDGGVSMGGGLRLGAAPALVADSVFRSNSARTGGTIASTGSAPTRIENSTFECNSSDVYGADASSQGNTFLGC